MNPDMEKRLSRLIRISENVLCASLVATISIFGVLLYGLGYVLFHWITG